ncbi:MAG TPA: Re/Si-specific NAD(P)(+) transhydrogenase subunit alpha [Bacteriovoracaceae bacterium]|nr:Re/Si-specific NAD(P)(+) transhydrogenase subunit alpha [Bacteriovoracaceae bacterium]
MKVGIPREILLTETRVAATPKTVQRLKKQGFDVYIQKSAGEKATYSDDDYIAAGAEIYSDASILYQSVDIILKVQPLSPEEIQQVKPGTMVASFLWPAQNSELLRLLAERKINAVAMDAIPRISRAQKMDVLSSMANIAGYRAVIEGANHYGKFLNGQITAAGKVDPAKVLIIGAGVAGLAAIGTAHNLGAIVRAFDTRKEVREQIESMGAQFLTVQIDEDGATSSGYSKEMSQAFIDAEMALFRAQAKDVDIIITTALIPGRPAPKLILKDMIEMMKPGSVVVDLAASAGGNCELTKPGEIYTYQGVTIVGKVDQLPTQASGLYGNNLCHLLDDMGKNEKFKIDMNDDIIGRAMVVYDGKINWPQKPLSVSAKPAAKAPAPVMEKKPDNTNRNSVIVLVIMGIILFLIGRVAPPEFLSRFTVFILSCFIGWQVVWNVSHSLHTPLMSVTNAISGIIIVGGMRHIQDDLTSPITILALIAVFVATINIAGGFFITHRMLKMFRR